jgi:hypothetical protein
MNQTDVEFEGRWRKPQGTPRGELKWLPPGKGGLQTHVAVVDGRQVAVIRKRPYIKGFSVRVTGWVWSKPLADSVADKLHVGETEVKGFLDLDTAKQAVQYAMERLPGE